MTASPPKRGLSYAAAKRYCGNHDPERKPSGAAAASVKLRDLLDAAKFAERALTGQPNPEECRDENWIENGLRKLRAAIAAAEGR